MKGFLLRAYLGFMANVTTKSESMGALLEYGKKPIRFYNGDFIALATGSKTYFSMAYFILFVIINETNINLS